MQYCKVCSSKPFPSTNIHLIRTYFTLLAEKRGSCCPPKKWSFYNSDVGWNALRLVVIPTPYLPLLHITPPQAPFLQALSPLQIHLLELV